MPHTCTNKYLIKLENSRSATIKWIQEDPVLVEQKRKSRSILNQVADEQQTSELTTIMPEKHTRSCWFWHTPWKSKLSFKNVSLHCCNPLKKGITRSWSLLIHHILLKWDGLRSWYMLNCHNSLSSCQLRIVLQFYEFLSLKNCSPAHPTKNCLTNQQLNIILNNQSHSANNRMLPASYTERVLLNQNSQEENTISIGGK